MAARRATTPDAATTSAIEQLIQSRTAGLYALAGKVRDLATARDKVAAAQENERALLAEALQVQEQLLAAGWTLDELRQAGLYVGAPAVTRRRRRRTTDPAPGGPTPSDTGATAPGTAASSESLPAPRDAAIGHPDATNATPGSAVTGTSEPVSVS